MEVDTHTEQPGSREVEPRKQNNEDRVLRLVEDACERARASAWFPYDLSVEIPHGDRVLRVDVGLAEEDIDTMEREVSSRWNPSDQPLPAPCDMRVPRPAVRRSRGTSRARRSCRSTRRTASTASGGSDPGPSTGGDDPPPPPQHVAPPSQSSTRVDVRSSRRGPALVELCRSRLAAAPTARRAAVGATLLAVVR